jgi:hypothetical protein
MVFFNYLILSCSQFVLSMIFICLTSSHRLRFVSVWLIIISWNIINFMSWSSSLGFSGVASLNFTWLFCHCLSSCWFESFFFQRRFFTFISIVMLLIFIILFGFRFVLFSGSRSISFFFQLYFFCSFQCFLSLLFMKFS